jgi:hypothetical protein
VRWLLLLALTGCVRYVKVKHVEPEAVVVPKEEPRTPWDDCEEYCRMYLNNFVDGQLGGPACRGIAETPNEYHFYCKPFDI